MAGQRILVVDDEGALRLTIVANLELAGFEIMEAEDGAEAIELLQQHEFDVVLSDIRMPRVDGLGLLDYVRRNCDGTPIILMTAFTTETDVQTAIEGGVFTVLRKPFDIDDVVSTLARAMRRPTVLVCDDDTEADKLALALSNVGVSATAVVNGTSAVEYIRDRDVDVCLMELTVADIDAGEMIARIRAIEPGITVIAMSARDVPELIREVSARGAYRCLRKPIVVPELVQLIAEARGSSDAGATTACS